ncbi:MAG TPA: hypothetical protein ENK08_02255 [Chloroflexi bacterium]|nr:hypothetical protein [Chloroflexota bacterium]
MPNVYTLTDRPLRPGDKELFGWRRKAQTLALNILTYDLSQAALTVGVQGDWGAGKTSFINLVLDGLGEDRTPQAREKGFKVKNWQEKYPLAARVSVRYREMGEETKYSLVIPFDCWMMSHLPFGGMGLVLYLLAVLEDFVAAMTGEEGKKGTALQAFVRYAETAGRLLETTGDVLGLLGVPGAEAAGWGIRHLIEQVGQKAQARLQASEIEEAFRALVGLQDTFRLLVEQVRQIPPFSRGDTRLVVVVDDLDRVPPRTALEITEKLKLFLDVPYTVFIIGADMEVVARGLQERFGGETSVAEGRDYINKIVRLSYPVPRMTRRDAYALLAVSDAICHALYEARFSRWRNEEPQREEEFPGTFVDELLFILPNTGYNPRNLKKIALAFGVYRAFFLDSLNQRGWEVLDADNAKATYFRLLALAILYQYNLELAKAFHQYLVERTDAGEREEPFNGERARAFLQQKEVNALLEDPSAVERFFAKMAEKEYTIGEWLRAFAYTSGA